jgi:hypothetical protein
VGGVSSLGMLGEQFRYAGRSGGEGSNVFLRDAEKIMAVNTQPLKIAPIFYCIFEAYLEHIWSIFGAYLKNFWIIIKAFFIVGFH